MLRCNCRVLPLFLGFVRTSSAVSLSSSSSSAAVVLGQQLGRSSSAAVVLGRQQMGYASKTGFYRKKGPAALKSQKDTQRSQEKTLDSHSTRSRETKQQIETPKPKQEMQKFDIPSPKSPITTLKKPNESKYAIEIVDLIKKYCSKLHVDVYNQINQLVQLSLFEKDLQDSSTLPSLEELPPIPFSNLCYSLITHDIGIPPATTSQFLCTLFIPKLREREDIDFICNSGILDKVAVLPSHSTIDDKKLFMSVIALKRINELRSTTPNATFTQLKNDMKDYSFAEREYYQRLLQEIVEYIKINWIAEKEKVSLSEFTHKIQSCISLDDTYTNNLLLYIYNNTAKELNIPIIKAFVEGNVPFNENTYPLMTKTYLLMGLKEKAIEIFQKTPYPTAEQYVSFMKYYAARGQVEAIESWQNRFLAKYLQNEAESPITKFLAIAHAFNGNENEVTTIINQCRFRESTILKIMQSFIKGGHYDAAERLSQKVPTQSSSFSYENKLAMFVESNQLEKVDAVLAEMRKNNIKFNATVFSLLMRLAIQQRDERAALSIIHHAKEANELTSQLYYPLVQFYCNRDESLKAIKLISSMKEEGVTPTIAIYTCLLHHLFETPEFTKVAETLVKQIVKSDVTISNITFFETVIAGFLKINNLDEAKRWLLLMESHYETPPNANIYASFVNYFTEKDRIDEAEEYALKIESLPDPMLSVYVATAIDNLYSKKMKE